MGYSARQLPERFHLLGLAQLVFQLFAGNELANLAAQRGEHCQQLVIRRVNLRAEKLDDAQGLLPQLHWNGEALNKPIWFARRFLRRLGSPATSAIHSGRPASQTRPTQPSPAGKTVSRLRVANSLNSSEG